MGRLVSGSRLKAEIMIKRCIIQTFVMIKKSCRLGKFGLITVLEIGRRGFLDVRCFIKGLKASQFNLKTLFLGKLKLFAQDLSRDTKKVFKFGLLRGFTQKKGDALCFLTHHLKSVPIHGHSPNALLFSYKSTFIKRTISAKA